MEMFKILKPVLWFKENSVQPRSKLNSILTNEAIATLVENEYLEFVTEKEEDFVYILFGSAAVRAYEEQTLHDQLKNGSFNELYDLQKLPSVMSTLDAFNLASGWGEYIVISKSDYEELKSL